VLALKVRKAEVIQQNAAEPGVVRGDAGRGACVGVAMAYMYVLDT